MKLFLLTFILIGLSASTTAFAALEYAPIVGIPKIDAGPLSAEGYINAIYFLTITAAALLAVVKIIYGGVQYMLDGVVTHKEQAKKEIQGALFGLLIVLSAVLILNTINPHLTKLNIFGNAPALEIRAVDPNANALKPVSVGDFYRYSSGNPSSEAHFIKSCVEDGHGIPQNQFLSGGMSCDTSTPGDCETFTVVTETGASYDVCQ